MSLEEEERLMRAQGMILRTGKAEDGTDIEYWDIPRSPQETREAANNKAASKANA
jgi:hypothetical protein